MPTQTKTAIVTGASKGIGAALATRLAADGFAVIVNYSSSAADAEKLVGKITAAGGRAKAVRGDVADPVTFKTLFDAAEKDFGPVDVLVNNAGIATLGLLKDVTDADYQKLIAVNLTGSFNGMREGATRVRDGGRIINISTSIIGTYIPTYGVYAATKSAVEAMTRTLAKELGKRKVTVNAVAPGPVETELFMNGKSPDLVQQMVGQIPLGRLGQPDDIAGVVSFLAGPDSGWVNGQIIKANGGRN